MKTVLFVMSAVVLFAFSTLAADLPAPVKTKYSLVKLVERDNQTVYQVLDPTQLGELQGEIKAEERLFDRAMMMTEKAWKTNEATRTKLFPRSAIGHRSCNLVSTYFKQEDANKALSAAEDRMAHTASKKTETRKAEAEKRAVAEEARGLFATKLSELKTREKEPADAKRGAPDAKAGGAKDAKAPGAKAVGAADPAGREGDVRDGGGRLIRREVPGD